MRAGVVAAACVAAVGIAAGASWEASSPPADPPTPVAPAPAVVSRQLTDEAEAGLRAVWSRWGWRGWLKAGPRSSDWAPLWHTVHLAMAAEGVAAATGRESDIARVRRLLRLAEGYWNPDLGGYAGKYETRGRAASWFDDNGWLGLAFFEAYRETGERRFLVDATRALDYMLRDGWDRHGGGIWWNDERRFKAGESVVTAGLLAVRLHAATGNPRYLAAARRIVDWTDAHLYDRATGLYLNRLGGGPVSYLQSPMLDAIGHLCRYEGLYCRRLRPLADATFRAFGGALTHAPQYDAMYLRFLVDAQPFVSDPRLAAVVRANAQQAARLAWGPDGVYSRDWLGGHREAPAGWLQTHAATVEALAWAAALRP